MLVNLSNILSCLLLNLARLPIFLLNSFIMMFGLHPFLILLTINITSFSYNFSHFVWVYPLRYKSDVFSKFVHFRQYVKIIQHIY